MNAQGLPNCKRGGFTLIEIVAVIVVVMILAAMARMKPARYGRNALARNRLNGLRVTCPPPLRLR